MGVWSQLLGKQFIDWLDPAGGLRWIDVGFGSGAFTSQIAELCSPSEGVEIDPSDAQIKFAQNRLVAKPVNFQTGDAMALPLKRILLIRQRWPYSSFLSRIRCLVLAK